MTVSPLPPNSFLPLSNIYQTHNFVKKKIEAKLFITNLRSN